MRYLSVLTLCLFCLGLASSVQAQGPRQMVNEPIDESKLVTLGGNTTPAATRAQNDRGPVADDVRFDHLLLLLKRDPQTEADLKEQIEAMHNPASPEFHHWLTPEQIGTRFGIHPQDMEAVQQWLKSHGFTVNQTYKNGLVLDLAGTAKQLRDTFHADMHNLVLPNGDKHTATVRDPQIPAALAPVIEGVTSLHDFFPRPRLTKMRPISFNHESKRWQPKFNVPFQGFTFNVVAPYDFATIYNLLPLWNQGFTGKGVTIALVEDSNLANPKDWSTFRKTFGLSGFSQGNFKQVYPNCPNPGQNGDEIEAALDVEWSSAAAPDANIVLAACGDTQTTAGLDLAILGILETNPPDIISDSYGLCETITGQAEVALENFEAELATAEGVTFFIAQGDTGADECAPVEHPPITRSSASTAATTPRRLLPWTSAAPISWRSTTRMSAEFRLRGIGMPRTIRKHWLPRNHTFQKFPWNDSCASRLIYTDPLIAGGFTQSFGNKGFCNSSIGQDDFLVRRSGQRRSQHMLHGHAVDTRGRQRFVQGKSKAFVSKGCAGRAARRIARPAGCFVVRGRWRVGQLLS